MPGRQTMETYILEGGIGYMLGKRWSIGAKIDYLTASNAKKRCPEQKHVHEPESVPGSGLPNT